MMLDTRQEQTIADSHIHLFESGDDRNDSETEEILYSIRGMQKAIPHWSSTLKLLNYIITEYYTPIQLLIYTII